MSARPPRRGPVAQADGGGQTSSQRPLRAVGDDDRALMTQLLSGRLTADPFLGHIPEGVLAAPLPGPGYPLTLVRHLREHLIWMRLQGRSERTLFSRRRACVRLAEFLGRDPATAARGDLHTWQIHLLGTSRYQVSHQTSLVRPYYGWLHALGIRADNPAALLLAPPIKKGLPRPIAEEALTTAVLAAPPRERCWLLLAGWSGLRAAEIAGLRGEDFLPAADGTRWVRVTGKGERTRDVPVPEWAWTAIADVVAAAGPAWRRLRGPGRGAITAHHVSNRCNELLHGLGFADTLHSLRHRAATQAYRATTDLRLVQTYLGHLTSKSTEIYTLVEPGRIAATVDGLPHPVLPIPPGGRHLHVVDATQEGTTA